jgi:hypothetical protein
MIAYDVGDVLGASFVHACVHISIARDADTNIQRYRRERMEAISGRRGPYSYGRNAQVS